MTNSSTNRPSSTAAMGPFNSNASLTSKRVFIEPGPTTTEWIFFRNDNSGCDPAAGNTTLCTSKTKRTAGTGSASEAVTRSNRLHGSLRVFRQRLALIGFSIALVPWCGNARSAPAPGLDLKGDVRFDSDSVAFEAGQEQRWNSFPGGRLCLNPARSAHYDMPPIGNDFSLHLGGYLGKGVVRLSDVLTANLQDPDAQSAKLLDASRCKVTWYPYKLVTEGSYSNGAKLEVSDFFVDSHSTLIRRLQMRHGGGKTLVLQGRNKNAKLSWIKEKHVLLATTGNYIYALKLARLQGEQGQAQGMPGSPVIDGTSWRWDLPLTTDNESIGMSFGLATAGEGDDSAIRRAEEPLTRPVHSSLAETKAEFDRFLAKVPKPAKWGVSTVPDRGVTPEQHRIFYYMAWTFLHQSVMNALPENPEYPHPQMTLGKPALWRDGDRTAPPTCSWESLLGAQWLSFVEPEQAWTIFTAITSLINEKGQIGGESLPSRKAQTAWILYTRMPDRRKLEAVYPAIKRYLLWRENNPKWSYSVNRDEKDIEYVVSWLFDLEYAKRIAKVLGLADDVTMWQDKRAPALDNIRLWFFTEPDAVHQYYSASRGAYSSRKKEAPRPSYVLTSLSLPDMRPEMAARLQKWFREIHDPAEDCAGFNVLKYPDANLIAYGLLDRGMPEARPYLEAVLRDCIRVGGFGEVIEIRNGGKLAAGGVKPSLFNPLNIIEFTWMLNGVRYDSGELKPYPPSGKAPDGSNP